MEAEDADGFAVEDGERIVFTVRQLWQLHEIEQAAYEETSLEKEHSLTIRTMENAPTATSPALPEIEPQISFPFKLAFF